MPLEFYPSSLRYSRRTVVCWVKAKTQSVSLLHNNLFTFSRNRCRTGTNAGAC